MLYSGSLLWQAGRFGIRSAFALRIISGIAILDFAFVALCGALQTHFHRWGRYGKRQMQRRFLRKRGAAGIPDHHFIKQKAIAFAFLHQRWLRIGAADEARTRYLHLGKVALYQMSYGRISGAFIPAPSHSYFKRGPHKNLRSKVLWGKGENLVFITEVLLARLL